MRSGYILVAATAALAVLPLAVSAREIRVPLDQPTIQEGLDAADAGDTVIVASGTYIGTLNRDLDFAGRNMTLRGGSPELDTFIDCEGLGRAFNFHSGEDTTAVVEYFTVLGAAADSGGGAICRAGSSPRFLRCRFEANEATDYGGGVFCIGASPVFRFCEFEGNVVSGGSYPHGGGVACVGSAGPLFHGCVFVGNTAGAVGGAVFSNHSDPVIRDCIFQGNAGGYDGGGVFASASGSLTITDCVFESNAGTRGAIYTQSCPVVVTGCEFSGHGDQAVAFLYSTSTGQVSHCTFINNRSHFYCFDSADVTVSNCTFVGSSSSVGGMIVDEASPTFEDCIFAFSTGPAAGCPTVIESPSFTRCVLFSNEGGDDLCGSVSDTLHRNPWFCDLAEGVLDLCQDSVCAPDNNTWTELIGALDVGCPACGSPVEPATWGSIKGLFR